MGGEILAAGIGRVAALPDGVRKQTRRASWRPWPRRGKILCLRASRRGKLCAERRWEVEMMVERRLKVVIPEDHRIVVNVPEDIPAGPAELILMAEMAERPAGGKAGEITISESAKARFESLAEELAADPRSFRDLSPDERRARLRRVVGIGREIFSPSEEIARRKEEEIGLEERRLGR
jgi:hypothetical protein